MSLKWSTKKFITYMSRYQYREKLIEEIITDILIKLEGIEDRVSKEQIASVYEEILIEKIPSQFERDSIIKAVGLLDLEIMKMTYVPIFELDLRYEQIKRDVINKVDKQKNDKFHKAEREKFLKPLKEASKNIARTIKNVSETYDKANEISEQYLGVEFNTAVTNVRTLKKDEITKEKPTRNMRNKPSKLFRRLCLEIESKIDNFLEDEAKDFKKTKATESAKSQERDTVLIRAKSIDELNGIIKNEELYLPIGCVNFDNEINELQLRVGIDRSHRISTIYEDRWDSGERIDLLLQVQAKLLEPELKERRINEYLLVKFGDIKIKPILGERNIPKKSITNDYRLAFPCEAKDVKYIEKIPLSESEILDLLYEYHTSIFDSLNRGEEVMENIPFILFDESISPDFPDIDNYRDEDKSGRDGDNWSREDFNEYYGYERDYDGDWD